MTFMIRPTLEILKARFADDRQHAIAAQVLFYRTLLASPAESGPEARCPLHQNLQHVRHSMVLTETYADYVFRGGACCLMSEVFWRPYGGDPSRATDAPVEAWVGNRAFEENTPHNTSYGEDGSRTTFAR